MIHLTYRQAFALALALFVVASLVFAPVAAFAVPVMRGWAYTALAPANPQLGDGWLPTSHQNLRYWSGTHWEPVGGKWYKVASRADDSWPDGVTFVLKPEPGMPQALGFESWDALAADIASPDGVISDVGLWHDSNFGSQASNYFDDHPANGLTPAGRPYQDSHERWLYFVWHRSYMATSEQVYVRFQGTDYGWGAGDGPVIRMEIGLDAPADMELALYVKI